MVGVGVRDADTRLPANRNGRHMAFSLSRWRPRYLLFTWGAWKAATLYMATAGGRPHDDLLLVCVMAGLADAVYTGVVGFNLYDRLVGPVFARVLKEIS